MPILVKCSCGKAVNVRDELAGKAIKCPGCGKPVRVGGASAPAKAAPTVARPAAKAPARQASAPASVAASGGLESLFAEEGFNRHVAAVCPACRSEMAAGAVLCTKCGYNKQTGQRLESHKTAGIDVDHGTLALRKAEQDLHAAKAMQDSLLGAGMPWWMMALILFLMVSATTIAVIAVNASRRVDESLSVNPLALFLLLGAGAFLLVAQGANLMLLVKAFQKNLKTGLLVMFVPLYILYFVFKNFSETWRYFVVAIFAGGIAAGFYAAAIAAGL